MWLQSHRPVPHPLQYVRKYVRKWCTTCILTVTVVSSCIFLFVYCCYFFIYYLFIYFYFFYHLFFSVFVMHNFIQNVAAVQSDILCIVCFTCNAVIPNICVECRYRPDFRFQDHISEEMTSQDDQPKKLILRRHRDCTSLEEVCF